MKRRRGTGGAARRLGRWLAGQLTNIAPLVTLVFLVRGVQRC